jgi:hypothetical protein
MSNSIFKKKGYPFNCNSDVSSQSTGVTSADTDESSSDQHEQAVAKEASHPIHTRRTYDAELPPLENPANDYRQASTEPQEESSPVAPMTNTPNILPGQSSAGFNAQPLLVPVSIPEASSDMVQQREPTQPPTEKLNLGQVRTSVWKKPATIFSQRAVQQPVIQTPTTDQPNDIPVVQEGSQQEDSPAPALEHQAPLAPPLPPPTPEQQSMSEAGQQRSTRRPRQDGKKSLVAVIDERLHSRVIMAAKARDISMTDMVILMIEHCCPAS